MSYLSRLFLIHATARKNYLLNGLCMSYEPYMLKWFRFRQLFHKLTKLKIFMGERNCCQEEIFTHLEKMKWDYPYVSNYDKNHHFSKLFINSFDGYRANCHKLYVWPNEHHALWHYSIREISYSVGPILWGSSSLNGILVPHPMIGPIQRLMKGFSMKLFQ